MGYVEEVREKGKVRYVLKKDYVEKMITHIKIILQAIYQDFFSLK
ncbi:MAG: hypothetical protein RXQ75_10375 [Acidianus hospitalis]